MAENSLDSSILARVFEAMGRHLEWEADVRVSIVGGAALALNSSLPPGRTTLDCDVMEYEPEVAEKAVEQAAEAAGREFDLPEQWFNSHAMWHRDSVPEGWQERRRLIGTYGRLRVFAADRRDLVVMKLISGRPQDLQDVVALIRADDVRFIRACLTQMRKKTAVSEQVPEAFERLDALEPKA